VDENDEDLRSIADKTNYGVYIGKNNLGIPPGVKLNIESLLNVKKEFTLKQFWYDYLINLFPLKIGDRVNITDASCQIVLRNSKDERRNRQTVRYYENIIRGIRAGWSFAELEALVAANSAGVSQLYRFKGEVPLSPKSSIAEYQQKLANIKAEDKARGIGGKTRKPNKKQKRRTNKCRKRQKQTKKNKRRT
jgi:hypothetical protein